MNLTTVSGKHHLGLVRSLCEIAGPSAGPNYSVAWRDKPHTLMWQLQSGYLSQAGADYLLRIEDSGRLVCGAGYYEHPTFTFEGEAVTMVMVRMWTHPEYRRQFLGTELLRKAASVARTRLCMVSFNQHNKALHDSLTLRSRGMPWPPEWRSFTSIGLLDLNYTKQWCAVAPTQSILT